MPGKFCRGFNIGRIHVQSPAVGPITVSEIYSVFANVQNVPSEVLYFWIFYQVKLTDGHSNGKTFRTQNKASVKQTLFPLNSNGIAYNTFILALYTQQHFFIHTHI